MDIEKLQRYRPFAVIIVAVLLIAFFPARDDAGTPGVDSSARADGASDVARRSADSGAIGVNGSPMGSSTDGAVTAGGSPSSRGTYGGATPAAAQTQRLTGTGLNSPAALAAPDCNPTTKRVNVPFLRAAPCAVPWPEGADNGGATTPGVTKTTIKVVLYSAASNPAAGPLGGFSTDEANLLRGWRNSSAPYERFYRQWGRKVEYAVFNATGDDEVAQRADAIKIASMKPFIVMQVSAGNTVLITELANRRVVVVANAGVSQALAQRLAPFIWGAAVPSIELAALSAANYVGKRLNNLPAKWAGQQDYRLMTRKFGLLQTNEVDQDLFEREFAKYGGKLTDKQTYLFGPGNSNEWAEQARTQVSRMKANGVTSVVALADFLYLSVITKEATNQGWFPEWITTGFLGNDIDVFAHTFDQLQWRNAFGVGSLYAMSNRLPPQFYFQAWYHGSSWGTDLDLSADETPLLFSGIHGSGPNLTPEGFRDGLFAVEPHGGAAIGGLITMAWSYGRRGYYPGDDYNGYDDFDEIWYDVAGHGKDNLFGQDTVGVYRNVAGGKRYFYNQYPPGEPKMFDPNGIAPYYADYPTPQERPPKMACTGCPSESDPHPGIER